MNELGKKLRDARIEKGYTLNTLQQHTKIHKKYLQAIEEGNLEEMPGNFYVRAFVKQYADAVGLDGDELLNQYEDQLSQTRSQEIPTRRSQTNSDLPSRLERSQEMEKSNWEVALSYLPLVILVLIILAIVGILITAINKTKQTELADKIENAPQSAIVSTIEPESVSVESVKEKSDKDKDEPKPEPDSPLTQLDDNQIRVGSQVLTLISDPSQETTYQLEGDISEYKFEVRADNFVWVGIFEDDSIVVDQTVDQGDKLEYTASENVGQIRITLGYPEGGKFYVNGVEVPVESDYQKEIMVFVNKNSTNQTNTQDQASGEVGPNQDLQQ